MRNHSYRCLLWRRLTLERGPEGAAGGSALNRTARPDQIDRRHSFVCARRNNLPAEETLREVGSQIHDPGYSVDIDRIEASEVGHEPFDHHNPLWLRGELNALLRWAPLFPTSSQRAWEHLCHLVATKFGTTHTLTFLSGSRPHLHETCGPTWPRKCGSFLVGVGVGGVACAGVSAIDGSLNRKSKRHTCRVGTPLSPPQNLLLFAGSCGRTTRPLTLRRSARRTSERQNAGLLANMNRRLPSWLRSSQKCSNGK